MRTSSLAWGVCVLIVAGAPFARAQPFLPESLPSPLKPWTKWVLDGAEGSLCPSVGEEAVCLWPGRLRLDVGARGGRFQFDLYADREVDVPLPGGEKAWPQSVTLDGRPVPVLPSDDSPTVRVRAGHHTIAGQLEWAELPDTLGVPAQLALVDLTVGGRGVAWPKREEDGLLVLKQQDGPASGGENLQLKVFRRLEDAMPLRLETHLQIEASGKAREVRLEGAAVPGSVALSVGGDLPARLDRDGVLRVQVRPGRFTVRLLARLEGRPESVSMGKRAEPWPTQEIWLVAPDERLRSVEVSGVTPIDPSRTEAPAEWKTLSAYLMEAGKVLALRETRRGEPEPSLDQLTLRRALWLDLGGRGFSVRDVFAGTVGRTTRLDLAVPGELGRVSMKGSDQLITRTPGGATAGVELRDTALALEADSRLPTRGRIPAVGWSAGVQSLNAEVHLPPGWRLFAAPGADAAPRAWVSGWELSDFFLLVLTVFLTLRLLGPRWAGLALVMLVLTHGESGAPQILWLAVLGLALVRSRLSAPKVQRAARVVWVAAMVLLVVSVAAFAIDHLRDALYPHYAPHFASPGRSALGEGVAAVLGGGLRARVPAAVAPATRQMHTYDAAVDEAPAFEAASEPAAKAEDKPARPSSPVVLSRDNAARTYRNLVSTTSTDSVQAYEQDPNAVIQTGPGMPRWSWATYSLSWSGPVDPSHTVRLILISPTVNAGLAVVRVLLIVLLVMRLAASHLRGRLPARLSWITAAVLIAALSATHVSADETEEAAKVSGGTFPSAETLAEMRKRLTRGAACAPECVSTARLHVSVTGGDLRLESEIHAGADAAWAIPGPAAAWVPRVVTIDGQSAIGQLARLEDGFLHLRIPAGVHRIVATGPMPPADSVTLQTPQRPRRVAATATEWQIDGIREDGTTDGSLQLTRRVQRSGAGQADGVYEPWLEVTRVFDIGVKWQADTVVRRVSPTGAPVLVKVPLLKGMLVTSAEHQVQDGEVTIALGRDQVETRWSSTLTPVEGETIVLEAPSGRPWSEVWIVRCGFAWQCVTSGVVPVARRADDRLAEEFRPWPGERLSLTFHRPKGQPGSTVTIDGASLVVSPGLRLRDVSLTLQARASRTSPLALTLPGKVELREVKIDGQVKPVRLVEDKLPLSLDAGAHRVEITWREAAGVGTFLRTPRIDLGQPAVNVDVTLRLPRDRWLLLVAGPPWGPKVLFWAYLALLLAAAWGVSRLPGNPLKPVDWLLLAAGLAFSPLSVPLLVIVAGWFFATAWRGRTDLEPGLHNARQVGLALWTALFLVLLAGAVSAGLSGVPDMGVTGASSDGLRWYVDRTPGPLPTPWALSVPSSVYRVLVLGWALWLMTAVGRWLRWAWTSATTVSVWKKRPAPDPKVEDAPVA